MSWPTATGLGGRSIDQLVERLSSRDRREDETKKEEYEGQGPAEACRQHDGGLARILCRAQEGRREAQALMPSTSEKQRRFMGAELGRKRAGKKTRTGMSEAQLRDFAKKSKGRKAAKRK